MDAEDLLKDIHFEYARIPGTVSWQMHMKEAGTVTIKTAFDDRDAQKEEAEEEGRRRVWGKQIADAVFRALEDGAHRAMVEQEEQLGERCDRLEAQIEQLQEQLRAAEAEAAELRGRVTREEELEGMVACAQVDKEPFEDSECAVVPRSIEDSQLGAGRAHSLQIGTGVVALPAHERCQWARKLAAAAAIHGGAVTVMERGEVGRVQRFRRELTGFIQTQAYEHLSRLRDQPDALVVTLQHMAEKMDWKNEEQAALGLYLASRYWVVPKQESVVCA